MRANLNGKIVTPWTIETETYTVKKPKPEKRVRTVIRRWTVDKTGHGKNERLPNEQYKHLVGNRQELGAFVRRLNAEIFREQARIEAILDRTAFLNERMLEMYREHLEVHVPNEKKINEMMNMLKEYVINVFVGQFNLVNPKDWIHSEDRWYKWLLEDPAAPKAASTKKRVIQALNRFIRWLHKKRQDEIPLVEFEGPGFRRLNDIERDREAKGEKKKRGSVPDSDWEKIKKDLPKDIEPFILLCYHYGLRRNESLGLTFEGTDCVFSDYIVLKKQLVAFNPKKDYRKYDKLKTQGRQPITHQPIEERKIPHWFEIDPNVTADWIEDAEKKLMHPTSLTKRWRAYMERLKMTYDIHDLRHTWITKARSKYPARDVQLAAGHASIQTTEKYSHDHRSLEKKPIRPRKVAA